MVQALSSNKIVMLMQNEEVGSVCGCGKLGGEAANCKKKIFWIFF